MLTNLVYARYVEDTFTPPGPITCVRLNCIVVRAAGFLWGLLIAMEYRNELWGCIDGDQGQATKVYLVWTSALSDPGWRLLQPCHQYHDGSVFLFGFGGARFSRARARGRGSSFSARRISGTAASRTEIWASCLGFEPWRIVRSSRGSR